MKRVADILSRPTAAWMVAAAIAAVTAIAAVWFGAVNQDEGWYLYAAQMVRDGRMPYRDFFFTQGPTLPFVYSALCGLWAPGSPVSGLLGGRLVTLAFGTLATFFAVALVRSLVPQARRSAAALAVFALLACNLYHVYFTTIPKTYALGSVFMMAGFLLTARGLVLDGWRRAVVVAAGGAALAFASGTRISLLLALPAAGVVLLAMFRSFRWSFLWFGIGGAAGLFLVYGLFALDPDSLRGLLAAQEYHAARGGLDPFFAVGSISRLTRGYAATGVLLAAALASACCGRTGDAEDMPAAAVATVRMLALSFAAVFLLQISAPFPYDDYQVPVMGIVAVLVATWYVRRGGGAWFAVLASGMISFASPMLQDWATYGQDRFWSRKKEMSELAKLREVGREIEAVDPGGKTLLTQDLYLAVETGRRVPRGLEMGPFSYFPDMDGAKAEKLHVLNREGMERLLAGAPCSVAACSGYSFAISAPKCEETSFAEQEAHFKTLKRNYELVATESDFGQNATTLIILKRKEPPK